MGKSPGKWTNPVLFGKKSSKSNLSKDATSDKKITFTFNSQSNELSADSPVISSPALHVITHVEKSWSTNLMHDNAANGDELEQAATKVQAAFRGYLAQRDLWSLKCILRLQAVIRGHLVRRATVHCMRAIVEFQAVVRGQIVRLSGSFPQMLQKRSLQEHLNERADLPLRSEKILTNAFGVKEVEQGLGGVVLKTEDVEAVFELKDYLDKRDKEDSLLGLTRATITRVQMTGMGDRVCVDLCSLMRPGEGLLVGSFARGLFLVHSESIDSDHISSWPFRVNAGPVHAYVAVPGGKTCYLSELKAGKEILVVDQSGIQRTAVVGRVKIETRPLIIVDAKVDSDKETSYSILLQNSQTVGLVPPIKGGGNEATVIPVTSLKVGDEVVVRMQGGAGIEIQEFILEK